jgi:hypothetical protein
VWIGAEDVGDNNFIWTTSGNKLQFSNWIRGEPNSIFETCVTMNKGGKWNDFDCANTLMYVCEMNS